MDRHCARPGCSGPAVASLSYDYGRRRVWLDHVADERVPAVYDLCGRHADPLTVPRGWELEDRRTPVQPLFRAS
jgi:hypothetical protein